MFLNLKLDIFKLTKCDGLKTKSVPAQTAGHVCARTHTHTESLLSKPAAPRAADGIRAAPGATCRNNVCTLEPRMNYFLSSHSSFLEQKCTKVFKIFS